MRPMKKNLSRQYSYLPHICNCILEIMNDTYKHSLSSDENLEFINKIYEEQGRELLVPAIQNHIQELENMEKNKSLTKEGKQVLSFLSSMNKLDKSCFNLSAFENIVNVRMIQPMSDEEFHTIKRDLSDIVINLNSFDITKKEEKEFNLACIEVQDTLKKCSKQSELIAWYNEYKPLVTKAILTDLCMADFIKFVDIKNFGTTSDHLYKMILLDGENKNPFAMVESSGMFSPNETFYFNKDLEFIPDDKISNEEEKYRPFMKLQPKIWDMNFLSDDITFCICIEKLEGKSNKVYPIKNLVTTLFEFICLNFETKKVYADFLINLVKKEVNILKEN